VYHALREDSRQGLRRAWRRASAAKAQAIVHANMVHGLEHLCRYLLRPPLAQDRVRFRADGRVLVELKTVWRDGTSHVLFEPIEFLEKLAALIPRPAVNLLLYHGVLAARARWRSQVVSYGRPEPDLKADEADTSPRRVRSPRAWTWAALMRRVFALDVLACPRCGGRLHAMLRGELHHHQPSLHLPSIPWADGTIDHGCSPLSGCEVIPARQGSHSKGNTSPRTRPLTTSRSREHHHPGSGSKIARCLALSHGDAGILGALCSPPQGAQGLQCFLCAVRRRDKVGK
jgi:putative transposase